MNLLIPEVVPAFNLFPPTAASYQSIVVPVSANDESVSLPDPHKGLTFTSFTKGFEGKSDPAIVISAVETQPLKSVTETE